MRIYLRIATSSESGEHISRHGLFPGWSVYNNGTKNKERDALCTIFYGFLLHERNKLAGGWLYVIRKAVVYWLLTGLSLRVGSRFYRGRIMTMR